MPQHGKRPVQRTFDLDFVAPVDWLGMADHAPPTNIDNPVLHEPGERILLALVAKVVAERRIGDLNDQLDGLRPSSRANAAGGRGRRRGR